MVHRVLFFRASDKVKQLQIEPSVIYYQIWQSVIHYQNILD